MEGQGWSGLEEFGFIVGISPPEFKKMKEDRGRVKSKSFKLFTTAAKERSLEEVSGCK